MESIVFANSPLAEYLEGNGESEADWEVEPTFAASSDEPQHLFAPPASSSMKARINIDKLKRPRISDPGWGPKSRFYELFSKTIDTRLSNNENSRFLERFRYVIVASQLLNEHVNVSHYDRKVDIDPLSTEEDVSGIFGSQYARARYWVGSGGFVVVVSYMLSWLLKGGSSGRSGVSIGKASAALLMSMLVAILIFAQTRRKGLRSLRTRAIEFAVMFVENSQTFDVLASNAVTLIQEVELVSRGYRLSAPLPPITRLERDSQTRRCARLRKAILSSLTLAIPPHSRACTALRHLTQGIDLEKYYDIYDIQKEDLEELAIGVDSDEFDDMESLKALKALLHRLHTARRVFLCSLLALDADGCSVDYNKWGIVVDMLQMLGNLMGELGGELQRIMAEEEEFAVPPTPKSPMSNTPENERFRGQLRKLNSLSQALRGLQAKMHVLREESDRTLRDSSDYSEFGHHLLAHYDSIGSDLHALVDEWENSRSLLATSLDRQDRANSSSPHSSPDSLSGATLVGDTPRNSLLFNKEGVEWADFAGLSFLSQPAKEIDLGIEEVFEAIAEPRPRSTLTREERIKKVHEERIGALEQRKKAEAGLELQKELQAVLINRPAPRRMTSTSGIGRSY
ncbi:hypothetical protein RUND412_005130 [Rhizina undulata]